MHGRIQQKIGFKLEQSDQHEAKIYTVRFIKGNRMEGIIIS